MVITMGFFSWMTCDTNRSISNTYSSRGTFPVYVLIPKEFGGGHIEEDNYEGYGVFGGHDIYCLVAQWNKGVTDRMVGIDIACYDKDNADLKYPIKIAESPSAVYESEPPSKSCREQGYFYDEDEDEHYLYVVRMPD